VANLSKNKICCLIITFNPDESIFKLIETIENQVNSIIVVDNKSSNSVINNLVIYSRHKGISLILNKQNLGIAKALNLGIEKAQELNYEWVITFDQDTMPFNNIVEIISEVYNSYPCKEEIGSIGVNFSVKNHESYFKFSNGRMYSVKDYLITSGNLISIKAFLEVGGFREDFFIDNVDLEYSLRLRRHKKVNLISRRWGMIHKTGDPVTKKVFGIVVGSSNHSASRRYYMARNHVLLSKKYLLRFPYFIMKLNYFFIISLIQLMIVEDNKKSKMIASLKGVINGLFFPRRKVDSGNDKPAEYYI